MRTTPLRRSLAAGALALTAALGVAGIAGAAGDVDGAQSGNRSRHRHHLTAEQRECMKNAGAERPDGRPTAAERKQLRAAAKECGVKLPRHRHHRHHRPRLTDEQRECLQDAGITRPEGRPTAEDIAALKAAAEECDIELPEHFGERRPGPRLTDEQRECLQDAGITRPEGRPTAEDIAALKAAAEECDIELPEHFGEGRPGGPAESADLQA